jgi:hypothetical protein
METYTGNNYTRNVLTKYGNYLWEERRWGDHPERTILIDNAVATAWLNLDMRYQAYAENSWTENVIRTRAGLSKSCECDDCYRWFFLEHQIIQEVCYQVDCAYTKYQEAKEKLCQ